MILPLIFQSINAYPFRMIGLKKLERKQDSPQVSSLSWQNKSLSKIVLLGANLAECRAERNLNCRNSQGSGPWSGSDRCSILSVGIVLSFVYSYR